MEHPPLSSFNVALIGASSLRGKEVKGILEERSFPVARLSLLDTEEAGGQLTDFDGEPAIVQAVTRENFEDIDLAIFASSPSFTQRHWHLAAESGCQIIDLSYFLEPSAGAELLAPFAAGVLHPPGEERHLPHICVGAHPAAMAIAGIAKLVAMTSPLLRCVATVFEPVSERGSAGVEELHQQTLNLLSFHEIPRKVFDAQVAFNLLRAYGKHSSTLLSEVRSRIARHVETLLPSAAGGLAVTVVQAPVFHSYVVCCYCELADSLPADQLEAALRRPPFCVQQEGAPDPGAVDVAGSSDIVLGRIEKGPGPSFWVWAAMDNLRVAAINGVMIAEEILRSRR